MSDNDERAFPNEVFALIIDTLRDDHASLQNAALVCKDFGSMCQAMIFRKIKLRANPKLGYSSFIKRIHRFAALLRTNSNSYSIAEFVKTLTFDTYRLDHWPRKILDDLSFILHNLRSLTVIRMELTELLSKSRNFIQDIETGPTNRLKELVISHVNSLQVFENLCRMIACLTRLDVLAILNCLMNFNFQTTDLTLVLPSSLKVAVFGRMPLGVLRMIALGMSSNRPMKLHSLYLDLPVRIFNQENSERPNAEVFNLICRAIGPRTNVILGANDSVSGLGESFVHDVSNCFRELAVAHVTLVCPGEGNGLTFVNSLVSGLPSSVRQIRIDFDVNTFEWVDPGNWGELDAALMKRHELGLLQRVVFTCSVRGAPFTDRESYSELIPRMDRTVFHCVGRIPMSERAGFVEIDPNLAYIYPGLTIM